MMRSPAFARQRGCSARGRTADRILLCLCHHPLRGVILDGGGRDHCFRRPRSRCGPLGWQVATLEAENPERCLKIFRSNRDYGWIIFLGIVIDGIATARWDF